MDTAREFPAGTRVWTYDPSWSFIALYRNFEVAAARGTIGATCVDTVNIHFGHGFVSRPFRSPLWQYVFTGKRALRREAKFAWMLYEQMQRAGLSPASQPLPRFCWSIALFAVVASRRSKPPSRRTRAHA